MGDNNIGFKDLPKYLIIDIGKDELLYRPTIIKWENDGLGNAYFAMYARYYTGPGNINPTQVLFFVNAPSYDITEMLEKGVPAKYVKELADHSSLAMTERYTYKADAKKILEWNTIRF